MSVVFRLFIIEKVVMSPIVEVAIVYGDAPSSDVAMAVSGADRGSERDRGVGPGARCA